jgi:hypothetical protein
MAMPSIRVTGVVGVCLGVLISAGAASAQPPAQSFADLQSTLKVDEQVIIRDKSGRISGGGRVVSIGGSRLELRFPQGFLHRKDERRVFLEDAVGRIEREDSDLNGSLIGAGIGFLVAIPCLVKARGGSEDEIGIGVGCAVAMPLIGMMIGQRIDNAHHQTIYTSPGGARLTLISGMTPKRAGMALGISF